MIPPPPMAPSPTGSPAAPSPPATSPPIVAEVAVAPCEQWDRSSSVSTFDAISAEILADRIFACGTRDAIVDDDDDTFDDAHPDEGDRYVARMALDDAESEAKFVETLNERRERVAIGHDDDPAAVASLQRLARTAWTHERYARAAAARADWDPVIGPLAARAVRRAQRAAGAIARAAARAVTRVAIRARNSARARMGAPARLSHMRRPARPSSRPRAPHARRDRVSAVSSAGSGSDEPSPEPPGPDYGPRLPAGRQP